MSSLLESLIVNHISDRFSFYSSASSDSEIDDVIPTRSTVGRLCHKLTFVSFFTPLLSIVFDDFNSVVNKAFMYYKS